MINSKFAGVVFILSALLLACLTFTVISQAAVIGLSEILAGSAMLALAASTLIAFRKRSLRKWLLPSLTAFFFLALAGSLISGIESSFWLVALIGLFLLLNAILWVPLPQKTVSSQREQGTVKWFHSKKGYGFISRPNGDDLFVHYRGIEGDGHKTLAEGQIVEYLIVKSSRGLQAKYVAIVNE
ncbi:MAG: cold shock domain-containing protein [Pseudomonadota bacterium]|nr:cold shock domain-containing protein [Pseudomonadota bacterium]